MKKKESTIPITAAQMAQHIGARVELRGSLHAIRSFPRYAFLIVRDRTGLAQAVCPGALMSALESAGAESIVHLVGTVVASEKAVLGAELQVEALTVPVPVCEALPVAMHQPTLKATLPTLLDYAPLTLRHPTRKAVFKLSSAAMAGFRATLEERGFTEIQTPKLVESATEGGLH